MSMLEKCEFPKLPAPYDIALHDAVSFVLGSFKAVGIIASGTIVRGVPDATSDIDLWVIHLEPYRQRIQKFFNSVPVEIFVNPPWIIHTYFAQDQSNARPIFSPHDGDGSSLFWPRIQSLSSCVRKHSGYSRNLPIQAKKPLREQDMRPQPASKTQPTSL